MKSSTIKRPFRRANAWKALIEEWQQSNKSILDFCREKKIAASGFYTWRNRLLSHLKPQRKNDPKVQSTLFVPVAVKASKTLFTPKELILTYPNGCQLRITDTVEPAILKALNHAMGVQ